MSALGRRIRPSPCTARFWIAQIYVISHLPDRALEAIREPLEAPEKFSLAVTNFVQINVLAAAAYFQKNETARGSRLLELEISRHPDDDHLLTLTAQAYMLHGLFTNALAVIDHRLKLTPDDPNWLFSHGYVNLQLKNYDDAIAAMTRVLSIQTTNNNALFNRAVAYLYDDKLDAARADFLQLQKTFTNSFQVAYGLGEIARRRNETNEAIRNYKIYLANANPNTIEATNVLQRLHEFTGKFP